jgi:transcriptional regulator with XRE-family HTH domain
MIVRKLRLERGWSQEQLAQMSGLNIRTIQRIERGQNAGLESLKSLAAVFEIDLNQLQSEQTMDTSILTNNSGTPQPEQSNSAQMYAKRKVLILAFRFMLISALLFAINLATTPSNLWATIPTLVMTFIVLLRAANLLILQLPDQSTIQTEPAQAPTKEQTAIDLPYERNRFYVKALRYLLIIAMVFGINLLTDPQHIWAWWPALGMGFAILFSGIDALIVEPLKAQNKRK